MSKKEIVPSRFFWNIKSFWNAIKRYFFKILILNLYTHGFSSFKLKKKFKKKNKFLIAIQTKEPNEDLKQSDVKQKKVQIAYYLPNETYPYVTNSELILDRKKSFVKLKDVKSVIHKKCNSNYLYIFMEYLQDDNCESYTEFSDDASFVPWYNDKNNKVICFIIEKSS